MADNKFIERLKGENAAKSVLEVKNIATKTSFANMPSGTSNAIDIYSDARNDATAVLKGADNWKLNNTTFDLAPILYGDGRDLISTYTVTGNTTWINAVYTFTDNKIFTPNTKWVLKLCGHSLLSDAANIIDFSLIIKFNNQYIITKSFSVKEQAFDFCQEFVIDFSESEQNTIKMANTDTMTVQLLCADSTASATIYNGMTVLTALQRRTDTDAVASDKNTFKDLEDDIADIQEDIVDIHTELDGKVNIDGTSTMTAPLKFASGSMRGAIGPYLNGVGFWKMASDGTLTHIATLSDTQFFPNTTNVNFGSSTKKWKDLYLAGDEYLDNGKCIRFAGTASNRYFNIETNQDEIRFIHKYGSYDASLSFRAYTGDVVLYPHNDDKALFGLPTRRWNRVYATHLCSDTSGVNLLTVPNKLGTLATKEEVDLAANSGRMITDQGVWFAKMYAATVAPSAEDGTNYADFSQVDGDSNPIIVLYERQSGVWVQTDTITPPAEYDGYVPITSKIWDIPEQAGQQGGRILWNHQSKEFTPYPQIISFENINITGDSTVVMPATPTDNSIPNKKYVDDAVSGAHYHPDLFDWKWADHQLNDVQWLRADTFSWQDGGVYEAAYNHLVDDIDGKTLQSETIAGTTVQFYLADDGHKICPDTQESNVAAIYTATGVAWYYIIDIPNKRFKLPRSKHNKYAASTPVVGNGKTLGFMDGNGREGCLQAYIWNSGYSNGMGLGGASSVGQTLPASFSDVRTTFKPLGVSTDATKSGLIAQQTQETDQYKYLYFYVGNFTQAALENTAGLNAELFNNKVDIDAQNFDATGKAYLAGIGMPSSTYTDLTLGASGASYTAPVSGWIVFRSDNRPDATTRYIYFYGRVYTGSDNNGGTATTDIMWYAPVVKGSTFSIYHNLPAIAAGETRLFRIYHSKGEA